MSSPRVSPTVTDWIWYGRELERHAARAHEARRELEELERELAAVASRCRNRARGRGLSREELAALALELERIVEERRKPKDAPPAEAPDNVRQLWIPGARR